MPPLRRGDIPCLLCGPYADHIREDCTSPTTRFVGGGLGSQSQTSTQRSSNCPATNANESGDSSKPKSSDTEPSTLTNAAAPLPGTSSSGLTGVERLLEACLNSVGDLATERPFSETMGDIYRVLHEEFPEEYMRAFKRGFSKTTPCKDCDNPARKRGYCNAHYLRHKRAGDFDCEG